jgi:hypothetical protein
VRSGVRLRRGSQIMPNIFPLPVDYQQIPSINKSKVNIQSRPKAGKTGSGKTSPEQRLELVARPPQHVLDERVRIVEVLRRALVARLVPVDLRIKREP